MKQLKNISKIKGKKGASFIYIPEGIYFSEAGLNNKYDTGFVSCVLKRNIESKE